MIDTWELRVIKYVVDERCEHINGCINRVKFKVKDSTNSVIRLSCPTHLAGFLMDEMGIEKA